MNCGTVLYDERFQFSDGSVINKLFIVLCDFGTNYLVLNTTSQQKKKNKTAACQLKDKPPNFFLPANHSWFEKDTWIELDEVFEIDSDTLEQKKKDRVVLHKSVLSPELMKDILKCALQSVDIELFYLEFLERAYDSL
jgi:hypothetical protein